MSAKFYTLLTEIGAAKLASAAALGVPLKITKMAVGDGGGVLPTPDAKQTALVNEKRRADLNMLYIDPQNSSQIIAEQVIPETEGGWWIREVGLFDDTGALIAIGNCPESYKPQLAEGSGRTQTVRMVLITSSTENITLKIDPAVVLATRKYVDDKVLELKVYVDDLMAKHLAAADPHTQYAPKESPTLTGTPKAPTAPAGNNTTQIATTAFVKAALAGLVGSSPAALDTLNELAAALGNDPNFATTMTNALAGKQPLDSTLTTLSGKTADGIIEYLGLGTASKKDIGTGANQIPDMSEFTLENNFPSGSATGYLKVNIAGIRIIAGTVSIPFSNPSTAPVGTAVTGVFTLPSAFPSRLLMVIGCGGDMAALNSGYFSCATNGSGADGRSKFAWTYRAINNNLSSGATFANFLAIGI
ncbi:TPA: phage tail protein [Escherichia coli]|nr:phage tail protein [Escherichia coli]